MYYIYIYLIIDISCGVFCIHPCLCATVTVKGDAPSDTTDDDMPDCAVCLQACLHPVRLPCGHVFCFLCVKGTASRGQRCALCRRDIPPGYIFNPQLLCETELSAAASEDGYEWFYEGVNGWWQYDPRTSAELEQCYKDEAPSIEVLIAGFLYVIDFKSMVQMRRSNPSRRRRIKRDVATIADKKGIAGIKVAPVVGEQLDRETGDGTDTPVSSSAGPSAVAPAVRQRRTRAARGSDRSSVVSNVIPVDDQQTGAAFSTNAAGASGSQQWSRATHVGSSEGGQLRLNTDDAPSLHATILNVIPSVGENVRATTTAATTAATPVPRQLRSNTTRDVDDSALSATLKPIPGSATGSSVVSPCVAGSQLRSGPERCVDEPSLPVAPNTSPSDGQRIRHDIADVNQYHQDFTELDALASDVTHLEIGDDDAEDLSVVREVVGNGNE